MVDIDLSKPRWDQSTYWGRARHFFYITNPMNFFASDKELDNAKKIVDQYKLTKKMPEGYDEEKLWAMKYLADSAFHPDTGEKMISIGRMSAQVPMNTFITSCGLLIVDRSPSFYVRSVVESALTMLTSALFSSFGMVMFYKTKPSIVFWQWFNQNFNAIVNYTNRSGDAVITTKQILVSYFAACGGAVTTAVYLNAKAKTMNPLFARLVPFVAVSCANFINIPMMRSSELLNGTPVFTPEGKRVGESKKAARKGIFLVCISRVGMAIPAMTIVPILTNLAVQRNLFCHYPMAVIPFQVSLVCFCAVVTTPLGCAFFEQRASMSLDSLEPDLKAKTLLVSPKAKKVVYNKGL